MLQGVLYGIFPAVLLGAAAVHVRMGRVRKLSEHLHKLFIDRREEAAVGSVSAADARDAGSSVVSLMGDLKAVYRFKAVRQVSLLCRAMRKWDEDGVPDKAASEFGEFILKVSVVTLAHVVHHQNCLLYTYVA